jgi:hypothetical protein
MFFDDGHPEARDYDDNYVVLEPQPPRSPLPPWRAGPRRDPTPPRTLRIVPAPDKTPA